jgi:hypothetical protein
MKKFNFTKITKIIFIILYSAFAVYIIVKEIN